MNKLISKIRTVEILRSNETRVHTFEICENKNVGETLILMGPVQKKFNAYNVRRRIARPSVIRIPLGMNQGGFDTIKDCEKAIELRCNINFNQKGWFKSIETEYDDKGNPITSWVKRIKTTYDNDNQIINGIKQTFHGNGIQSGLKKYLDSQLQEVKHWHENGFLSYKGKYKNGEKEGEHISYSKFGRIETISSYQNGLLNGVHEKWGYTSEAGKFFKQSLTTYHKNEQHGPFKVWHINGVLQEEGNYYGGKLDGQFKEYDMEGNILINECYNMGVKKDT